MTIVSKIKFVLLNFDILNKISNKILDARMLTICIVL